MNTICFVVTHAMTVRLKLIGQLEAIHEAGFRPVIITSNGPDLLGVEGRFDVVDVGFLREISVFRDLRAFFRTLNALRRERPCIVNASTPKASLIGMVSAFIARVPVRIYTLRGIRYETLTGFKRFVVVVCERITALCAHRIIAVSRSVRDEYVRAGICSAKKIVVLGNGSSNGIEVRRFPTDAARTALGCNVRDALGFSHDAPVIGFVGRGTRDKGICELLDAFFFVRDVVPNVRLLIVGGFEAGDPLPREYMARIESNRAIRVVDFVQDTTPFYAVMNVFAFPSHREGLPVAPLEAAATGIPTVTTRSTGCIDAVIDGETGFVVDVGDVQALANALIRYLQDEKLRTSHGHAAREFVKKHFDQQTVWKLIESEYRSLLAARNLPIG